MGSVALALKSASAGTPARPGIHIVRVQRTLLAAATSQHRSSPIVIQFPCTGDLLVGMFNSPDVAVTSLTDNASNHWVSAALTLGGDNSTVSQILYAANASTGSTLGGITATLNGTTKGDIMLVLYAVAGANDDPLDTAATALGDQTKGGDLATVSLTPPSDDELIFNQTAIDFHTINGVVGNGFVLDSVVNAYDNDNPPAGTNTSTLDEDNGYAHIYARNPIPELFVYTYTQLGQGIQYWGSASVAFRPRN